VNPNYENHRSVSIDELTWSGDKMNKLTFTREGPKQIKNFDPYRTYKATTSSKQLNIRSRTDWTKGQPVKHVLTPQASKESWIRVSGVDFGNGAQNLRVKAASVADGNKIEIHKGSASGTLAGTCNLAKTSGWQDYADNDCEMSGLTGVVDQLFFVFKGSKDSTMGILEWEFQGTKREPEPQTAFGGKAWAVPGKIQAEDFDVPGYGAGNDTYSDNDSENHGYEKAKSAADSAKVAYRKDDAPSVDLYANATGIIVGYNQSGEWLEYTIDVAKDGDYTFFAAVATDNQNAGFVMSVDGKDITDTILAAKTDVEGSFDDYAKVQRNVTLTAGKHILRMTVTGDWFDVDYFTFVEGKDATDPEPIEDSTTVLKNLKFHVSSSVEYQVFDLTGTMLGTVILSGKNATQALKAAGYRQGAYMLKQVNSGKKFMAKVTK
jgi:hypothetical protein